MSALVWWVAFWATCGWLNYMLMDQVHKDLVAWGVRKPEEILSKKRTAIVCFSLGPAMSLYFIKEYFT